MSTHIDPMLTSGFDEGFPSRRDVPRWMLPLALPSVLMGAFSATHAQLPVRTASAPLPSVPQLKGDATGLDAGLSRAIRLQLAELAEPGRLALKVTIEWPQIDRIGVYRTPGAAKWPLDPDRLPLEPVVVMNMPVMQIPELETSVEFFDTSIWFAVATTGKNWGWAAREVKLAKLQPASQWSRLAASAQVREPKAQ
jgi:hypothetical protein